MEYVNPVEHGKILAEVGRLKDDIKRLEKRVDELEDLARTNTLDHQYFSKALDKLQGVPESLKRIEDKTIIMNTDQAKAEGNGWLALLVRNPTTLMWLILAAVVITMVIQGYNYAEISQVLQQIR